MSRGLRPSVGKGLVGREPVTTPSAITSVPLVDTLVEFMADKTVWDGTASELHVTLENYAVDLPGDATRLSKALSKLASLIEAKGIFLERTRVLKDVVSGCLGPANIIPIIDCQALKDIK